MIDGARRSEAGVALIFAIVMVIIVVGFLSVFALSSTTARDERLTERGRMQSEIWADAAGTAIAHRLEQGELGHQVTNVTIDGKAGRLLQPAVTGTTRSHGTGSCAPSFQIQTGDGGEGWYCILPPATGQPGGTGFLNLAPGDSEHGTVTFVVRAWGTEGSTRPIDVELTFGRESLSRFAVLSDAPITLDKTAGAGSLVLPAGARLHSNNTTGATHGVFLRGAVNHAAASRITTTRAASGNAVHASGGAPSCPNGNKCYVSGKTVSFNSTFTAFNRVAKADPTGTCPASTPPATYPSGFRMCRIPSTHLFPAAASTMPMFVVDVSGPCVRWQTGSFPLRVDSYSYPIPNDAATPTYDLNHRELCPSSGGGALLFEGDVLLRGVRPVGSPSVTIMARRSQSNAAQTVVLPSGGTAQVAEAASIYVAPVGGAGGTVGGSGASSTKSSLGIVAEGGVYIPTYGADGDLTMTDTSVIAAGSGFSLGPSFQLVAGDPGVAEQTANEVVAGGLDPCNPAVALPAGGTFTFRGTMASRQVPFLNYTRGGCYKGYASRRYEFATELGWNPPPFFPAPSPWHVVDSRVFTT